jgi:hypothetical protein
MKLKLEMWVWHWDTGSRQGYEDAKNRCWGAGDMSRGGEHKVCVQEQP